MVARLAVDVAMLACLVLPLPRESLASLLVYEPFDYAAGTRLDSEPATGLNLTGDYVALGTLEAQELMVEAPGLAYGSLAGAPSPFGNRISDTAGVTAAGATVGIDADVLIEPGDAVFWSALFTLDDSLGGNHLANITLTDDASGDELFFGEPVVGVGGIRISADTAATGALLADGADNAFTDGQTVLLIGRYFNSASPGGDTLELVGYDTAASIRLPASFDPLDANAVLSFGLSDLDIDMVRISSITFTIRGLDNNAIDELRIGSTYAAVALPEPPVASALAILALGGLLVATRVR